VNEEPGSGAPRRGEVRSADGTTIGYQRVGAGPAVVLLHGAGQTVSDAAGPLARFRTLTCEILLLGGSRSARNLTASLDGLSQVLPDAKRTVLHGAGHTAPDNSHQPERVAAELHRFFAA